MPRLSHGVSESPQRLDFPVPEDSLYSSSVAPFAALTGSSLRSSFRCGACVVRRDRDAGPFQSHPVDCVGFALAVNRARTLRTPALLSLATMV